MVLVFKNVKKRSPAKNYHLVCLLYVVNKVFEKLVNKPFFWFLVWFQVFSINWRSWHLHLIELWGILIGLGLFKQWPFLNWYLAVPPPTLGCSCRNSLTNQSTWGLNQEPPYSNCNTLKVQSCKLYNNKYIIASTQITNTDIFAFRAVLVFKLLSRKVLFINRKDNKKC